MRPRIWKLLGMAGLAGGLFVFVIGRSSPVAGDPVDEPQAEGPPIGLHEIGELYDLGPNAIPYEKQPTEEQDNIDRVAEKLEADHPASSSDAWARAADQALVQAQAEIASRHVGLEGVDEQGVVP
jgi:hypothetical protein